MHDTSQAGSRDVFILKTSNCYELKIIRMRFQLKKTLKTFKTLTTLCLVSKDFFLMT